MNLNYRILDCDLFESYMALEGWENFPYLRKLLDEDGSLGFMMQDFSFMIFDFTPSGNLLKAICMYQVFGDTLSIQYFEVSKEYRKMGVGSAAVERLLFETGAKRIELDACDAKAAKFWKKIGLTQVDAQHFVV